MLLTVALMFGIPFFVSFKNRWFIIPLPIPDGKKKRKLDKYIYDLGSCTFCQLCVTTCPQDALDFSNDFEQAVFTREKLVKQLNYLPEQEEPAPTPEQIAQAAAEREAKIAAAKAATAAKRANECFI